LGPVPGVLGSLQALEALKLLLDLPGRLGDELLTVDLLGLATSRLRARRREACAQGCGASLQGLRQAIERAALATGDEPAQLSFADLSIARAAGYALIDIREAREIADAPLPEPSLAIPMGELLAGRNLPAEGRYLLVCARGSRSLGTTLALRERGLRAVYSLQGGAQGLA
jgi:adenylyltransferase/sulfurtransferase